MNICLDGRVIHDHFPGIGRYAANLARALGPCLHASETLVVLRDPRAPSRYDLTVTAGQRIRVTDVPVSPFSLRQQWTLPKVLRGLDAHVYHSPYYLMPLWPRVRSVVTIHDLIPLRYPQYFSSVDRFLFSAAIRLAVNRVRRVIAVSASTARDITRYLRLPAERISVIREAADPTFHPQPIEMISSVRARLNLPESYVLYVGSSKPHKNLVRLVDAWSQLQPQTMPLIIAGPWDARYPEARRRTETLGLSDTIRFLGPVREADLPALYAGATLFVFPSAYEGFGLPVLEAMACGVPVACADGASLSELTGEATVRFDPFSVDGTAHAIATVLKDREYRAHLARLGVERAAQFSWADTARQTLSVYRQVMADAA